MCISPVRVNSTFVECRKCSECVVKRQNEWIFRIKQEILHHKNSFFITYQYNEKRVPIINQYYHHDTGETITERIRGTQNVASNSFVRTLQYKDIQDYFKRLRKVHPTVKHHTVGEYGEKKKRPHYHSIIMSNEDVNDTPFLKNLKNLWATNYGSTKSPDYEPNGHVYREQANHRTIRYVIKYMTKRIKDTPLDCELPKACQSRGLGKQYVEKHRQYHLETDRKYLVEAGGYKIALPKYYKDQIWNQSKLLNQILNFKNQQRKWSEYYKLSDYEKFVLDEKEKKKNSKIVNEIAERRLENQSKSKTI